MPVFRPLVLMSARSPLSPTVRLGTSSQLKGGYDLVRDAIAAYRAEGNWEFVGIPAISALDGRRVVSRILQLAIAVRILFYNPRRRSAGRAMSGRKSEHGMQAQCSTSQTPR